MNVDAATVHLRVYVEVTHLGEGAATDQWLYGCGPGGFRDREGTRGATNRRVALRGRSARAVRIKAMEAGNEQMIAFARLPLKNKTKGCRRRHDRRSS